MYGELAGLLLRSTAYDSMLCRTARFRRYTVAAALLPSSLVAKGEESPSVVLRLAPWRARTMARVLEEWSAGSRVFNRVTRPSLDELDLSRTLELAASVLGDGDQPLLRFPRGTRTIPSGQRLAAVAVLGEREDRLSAVQRLALVDAAAWWLAEPSGGQANATDPTKA